MAMTYIYTVTFRYPKSPEDEPFTEKWGECRTPAAARMQAGKLLKQNHAVAASVTETDERDYEKQIWYKEPKS